MSSISTSKIGLRRILFVLPDGKRKSLRIGRCSYEAALFIRKRVDQLLEAKRRGEPVAGELAVWLDRLPIKGRLAKVGLVEPD